VGEAEDRFNEDALRILRAIRLATELGFDISRETREGIKKTAHLLKEIAVERIQSELTRVIMSANPMKGLVLAHELDVLQYILPELETGIKVEQNGDHIYDVWEHNLRACQNAADHDWPLHIRLGALLHDIGKPKSRRFDKTKNDYTFYGHEVVGAKISKKVLERLKYPKDISGIIVKLVRWHMFFCDIDQITLSAVRRLISNVGKDNVWDLMRIRVCDRKGMGRPKEKPYRLRKYESMVEEAMRDPVSVKMLKIDGNILMKDLKLQPGPAIGFILHALLEEVLEDPGLNDEKYLAKKALELSKLPLQDLKLIGEKGKVRKDEEEDMEIQEIRKKYWVK